MRATIAIDELARAYFPVKREQSRRQADILAELQERLQDKGDDPRYGRVIFAVEDEERFVEVDVNGVRLAGVFPRISCVSYLYGNNNQGLRNIMKTNIDDTLVVADTEELAKRWEFELKSLKYTVKRI